MSLISLTIQFLSSNAFQKYYLFILPLQGSRSGRKRKYNYASYYNRRKATKEEFNNKRALERSRKRSGVQDIALPSLEERTRRVVSNEYGPPLFQINDMVTIIKDTSPGVSFMHSYDKIGRVTEVVDNEGKALNTYTVKVLFEAYSEEVDELWLKRCDHEGMMPRLSMKCFL